MGFIHPDRKAPFKFVKHPQAYIYSFDTNPELVLQQIIDEVATGRFPVNETFRTVMRQTAFVSMWFCGKFVAGYDGPFDLLNDSIHLDMCNERQSWLKESGSFDEPTAKYACFTGRKFYKSTIFTMLGIIWELIRNPNIVSYLFGGLYDRVHGFYETIKHFFEGNELAAWLLPEYVPEKNQERWNTKEFVLPNRTRYNTGPSLAPLAVMGSTAGVHGHLLTFDDLIGDTDLDSNRESSSEMYRKANWVKSNIRNLVIPGARSRVGVIGTRYAPDDAYEFIMNSVKEQRGYWEDSPEEYQVKDNGEWNVYYRQIKEYGVDVFPEAMSSKEFDRVMEEDPWTALTQYANNPKAEGISEFVTYPLKKCTIFYDEHNGYGFEFMKADKRHIVWLKNCYCVQAMDPGASAKRESSKTSRTASGMCAWASSGEKFVFSVDVGYVDLFQMYDWTFAKAEQFKNYMQYTELEMQGAFKLLENPFRREEERRMNIALAEGKEPVFLHLHPVSKTGEKDAMIRASLQADLKLGNIYVDDYSYSKVLEEKNVFPFGRKKDVLDMMGVGFRALRKPRSVEEEERLNSRERDDEEARRDLGPCGY